MWVFLFTLPLPAKTLLLPVCRKERVSLSSPASSRIVFQKLEAVLFEDGVVLPGILIFVAADDGGDGILIGLFKLGLDHFGDFFGGVGVDVFQAFLNRIGEFLDGVGFFSK